MPTSISGISTAMRADHSSPHLCRLRRSIRHPHSMDSTVLHILMRRALRSAACVNPGNGENVVVGDGAAIYAARLRALIDARSSTTILRLSLTRHEARSRAKHVAAEECASLTLPDQLVTFCDEPLRLAFNWQGGAMRDDSPMTTSSCGAAGFRCKNP